MCDGRAISWRVCAHAAAAMRKRSPIRRACAPRATRNMSQFDARDFRRRRDRLFSPGDRRMRTIRIQTNDFDIGAECDALDEARARCRRRGDVHRSMCAATTISSSLTLEHYPGMTEREIARHVDEAQTALAAAGCDRSSIASGGSCPATRIVFVGDASQRTARPRSRPANS